MIRIGNASGFYGDRYAAVAEMLTGGDLDVLTGDYLAELTMAILGRDRLRDPSLGYARTFLRQARDNLALALDRGVKVVTNAGGVNPAALAEAIDGLGTGARVGYVTGDDLLPRPGALTANAYLGGFGIAACLRAGADVVVTGRVSDASLVLGPAAAHFGWRPGDLDALAGAAVAGHVIECGTQATGGNYSFFTELADPVHLGFPIAEVRADGSSVITKHPGTGGAVTRGTVTAQLLYEIGGARYLGPDVTARFDTIDLAEDGPDRILISGVRGEGPPPTAKVGVTGLGGYRNEVTFVLTGLDVTAKADLVRAQFGVPGATWTLVRTDHADAAVQEEAGALLRCVVRDADPDKVGRAFGAAAVELALASYPGFHVLAPPGEASAYGSYRSEFVPWSEIHQVAVLPDGTRVPIPAPPATSSPNEATPLSAKNWPPPAQGLTRRAPLGTIAGARSGDKGGAVNIGVWVRTDDHWPWLEHTLTVEALRALLPETADLPVTRHVLPNLRAVNFVVEGFLGDGVAARSRADPQGKGVGEHLRSRLVDLPEEFL